MANPCGLEIRIIIKRSAIMNQNCIPFRSKQNIRRSCGTDIADLTNILPILINRHQSGNSLICSRVHHLINDIRFRKPVMRQCFRIIIDHNRNRTLCLQRYARRKTRQFRYIGCLRCSGRSCLCLDPRNRGKQQCCSSKNCSHRQISLVHIKYLSPIISFLTFYHSERTL